MGISPAAATRAACKSPPAASSASASENPEAKQIAPPAPNAESSATTSMVALRLTPMKAASIAPSTAERDATAGKSATFSRLGCTGTMRPANPTARAAPTIPSHQAPPPTTTIVSGANNRLRSRGPPAFSVPCTSVGGIRPHLMRPMPATNRAK